MAQAKKKAKKAAAQARANPYIRRIAEDEDLRQNIMDAYESARKAYARLNNGKSPSKQIFDDKKLQKEIKNAAESIKDASVALREAPKKKRSGGFGKVLLIGIAGAGVALAVSEGLRKKVLDGLFGAEEEFEYSSTTTASPPSNQTAGTPPEALVTGEARLRTPRMASAGHQNAGRMPGGATNCPVGRDVPPEHGEHAGGDRQRGRDRHEDPLRARGLRRLLLSDLGLLERLLEQPLGPHELERQHREPDRDQHERRAWRHEHDHAADQHERADDAEADPEQPAALAVRGPARLELLDQLGARAPLFHRATVCQTVLKGRRACPSLAGMTDDAIVVEGLVKSYGSVRALNGIDFAARTGSVLGLLGPNGAGKTTAVRILATLLEADAGTAGWPGST